MRPMQGHMVMASVITEQAIGPLSGRSVFVTMPAVVTGIVNGTTIRATGFPDGGTPIPLGELTYDPAVPLMEPNTWHWPPRVWHWGGDAP